MASLFEISGSYWANEEIHVMYISQWLKLGGVKLHSDSRMRTFSRQGWGLEGGLI